MKRSEINRAIEWAEALLDKHGVRLPRYAYWDMDKWAENKEHIDAIRRARLGWCVTDFGSGNFPENGAVLYTLRDADPGDPEATAPCRERYILLREGQRVPAHVGESGAADIVNRAGGVLALRLWNADEAGNSLDTEVRVRVDGIEREFAAGERMRLYPGESARVPANLLRAFEPEPGYGDLVIGELCPIGGGLHFSRQDARFIKVREIDEDEAVLRPLCDEYAKLI